MPPEETGERARRFRDRGFTAVKFGWEPMGQDEKTDIALVREARNGLGDDIDLLIDAGLVWDAKIRKLIQCYAGKLFEDRVTLDQFSYLGFKPGAQNGGNGPLLLFSIVHR